MDECLKLLFWCGLIGVASLLVYGALKVISLLHHKLWPPALPPAPPPPPPLYAAVQAHQYETLQQLLQAEADPNTIYKDDSVLQLAIKQKDELAVKLLLAHGAQPNRLYKFGNSPLYLAVEQKQPDLVRALLAHGADPDDGYENIDRSGWASWTRPLWRAIADNQVELVQLLLDYGADSTATNGEEDYPSNWLETCLESARRRTDPAILELMECSLAQHPPSLERQARNCLRVPLLVHLVANRLDQPGGPQSVFMVLTEAEVVLFELPSPPHLLGPLLWRAPKNQLRPEISQSSPPELTLERPYWRQLMVLQLEAPLSLVQAIYIDVWSHRALPYLHPEWDGQPDDPRPHRHLLHLPHLLTLEPEQVSRIYTFAAEDKLREAVEAARESRGARV